MKTKLMNLEDGSSYNNGGRMNISAIEESKELKAQFERLGRPGISERALCLLYEHAKKHDGNYKEVTKLIGRFHALYIAIDNSDYWKEIANRGYNSERFDLKNYNFSPEED